MHSQANLYTEKTGERKDVNRGRVGRIMKGKKNRTSKYYNAMRYTGVMRCDASLEETCICRGY